MSTSENQHDVTVEQIKKEGIKIQTGTRHVIRIKHSNLHVRLDIDPREAKSWDDTFTLYMKRAGETFKQVKTVKDDQLPGDAYVDLVFKRLTRGPTYSLEIDLGKEGTHWLFEDMSFSDLFEGS